MASGESARTVAAMNLIRAAGVLAGTYLIGAVIALATGLGNPADVLTNGTRLSAPSFIVAAELLGALLATRYRAGAVLVLLASGLSLAAAGFDGDVGHAGLTRAEVAWQGVEVAVSALVFALAAARLTRRPRRPAAAAAA
jgi:NADH:ubiquinone oxidoreductase subunit 6 (subunit J)